MKLKARMKLGQILANFIISSRKTIYFQDKTSQRYEMNARKSQVQNSELSWFQVNSNTRST